MTSTQRVMVVDDDHNMRRVLGLLLESEGYVTSLAASGDEALAQLADARPQFVFADLRMPGLSGIELLKQIEERAPGLPVAILTAHGDIPDAVQATHAGAVDFLEKPVGRERLLRCIHQHLPPPTEATSGWDSGFDTRSPRMQAVIDAARTVARTDAPVLIGGASGTGKEVLARAIHRGSRRAEKPFVAINCAALPPALLESELFGHVRGAFTGAVTDHPGLFRAAQGGTIFLDEIGDMPASLQAKLLRVLQEREVRPVGSTTTVPVDVRIISATHRRLDEQIEAGAFRSDLYYRLGVVTLALPTLAERREDVPLLVGRRLAKLVADGAPRRTFSAAAMEAMACATWPGNIRQLFNVVERAAVLSRERIIDEELVRRCLGDTSAEMPSFDAARAEFTQGYLRELLERAGGNITNAARLAGRNRTDFYKLLARHGLNPAEFKDAPATVADESEKMS